MMNSNRVEFQRYRTSLSLCLVVSTDLFLNRFVEGMDTFQSIL
jgi:hypothetical protein